ncbi:MAG: hypothetical protein HY658_05750 [Actinobacteria bacterium]|nr:hypothetical protein [Actinomycetota bacterium]
MIPSGADRPAGGGTAPSRRAALLGLVVSLSAAIVLGAPPAPASAQRSKPDVDRQVLVFIVDRVSFEELMAVEEVRLLARYGGAGLMSVRTVAGDRGPGTYLTLGAGARGAAPEDRVLAFNPTEIVRGERAEEIYERLNPGRDAPPGPLLLDPAGYARANEGRAVAGLLGDVLRTHGRTTAIFGNADHRVGRHRPGVLLIMDGRGAVGGGRLGFGIAPAAGPGGQPFRIEIDRPRTDKLGGSRTDRAVITFLAEGGRIPNDSPFLPRHVTVFDLGDTLRIDTEAAFASPDEVERQRREALADLAPIMREMIAAAAAPDVMVIVLSPGTSGDMDRRGDEVAPIVIARGDPEQFFSPVAPRPGALTSDTTRRIGIVSNEDVAPTILSFFGIRPPAEMRGSPIVVSRGLLPFTTHHRHLSHRRMAMPVQVAAGTGMALLVLGGALLATARRRVPRWIGRAGPVLPLAAIALPAALLAAGDLPILTYRRVGAFLAWTPLVAAAVALAFRRAHPLLPAALVGAGGLAYLWTEADGGWTAMMTPFLGGSAFDGARFYGLPNVFIGLLLAGGVFVAAVLPPVLGAAILFLGGLFAGLPDIGANHGGAITLFAASGLWLALRVRGRLGWREALLVAAVVALGLGLVLGANVLATDRPTHGSAFLEEAGRSPGTILATAARRLLIGWRLMLSAPPIAIPFLLLPVLCWLVVSGPGIVGEALSRHPAWRDALVVLIAGSAVAFLANDSGPSAAGLGFALAAAGLSYVVLVEARWKPRPA